ncbi:MAG: hypothetical protein ACTHYO_10405 [Micrococcaceae bacterium]
MSQQSFDDILGSAVLPVLTVWRTFNNLCGWCVKPVASLAGCFASWDEAGRPIHSNVCMPCRDQHGLNGHLEALREGRYVIEEGFTA